MVESELSARDSHKLFYCALVRDWIFRFDYSFVSVWIGFEIWMFDVEFYPFDISVCAAVISILNSQLTGKQHFLQFYDYSHYYYHRYMYPYMFGYCVCVRVYTVISKIYFDVMCISHSPRWSGSICVLKINTTCNVCISHFRFFLWFGCYSFTQRTRWLLFLWHIWEHVIWI